MISNSLIVFFNHGSVVSSRFNACVTVMLKMPLAVCYGETNTFVRTATGRESNERQPSGSNERLIFINKTI